MRDFGAHEPFWPSRCHAGRLAIQTYFSDETIRNTVSISTLPRLRWGWEYIGRCHFSKRGSYEPRSNEEFRGGMHTQAIQTKRSEWNHRQSQSSEMIIPVLRAHGQHSAPVRDHKNI